MQLRLKAGIAALARFTAQFTSSETVVKVAFQVPAGGLPQDLPSRSTDDVRQGVVDIGAETLTFWSREMLKSKYQSAIEFTKAKVNSIKEDINIVRDTPQYATFIRKCEPIVASFNAAKKRISAGVSDWRSKRNSSKATRSQKAIRGPEPSSAKTQMLARVPQKNVRSSKPRLNLQLPNLGDLREKLATVAPRLAVAAVVGVMAYTVWHWYERGDYVAAAATLLAFASAAFGYRLGVLGILASLAGAAAAYFAAPKLGIAFEHLAAEQFETSGILNRAIAVALATLVCYLVVSLATVVVFRMLRGASQSSFFERALGTILGTAHGVALTIVVLGTVVSLKPFLTATQTPQQANAHERITKLVDAIENSRVQPLVRAYNPFDTAPQFKDLQRAISKLQGPDQIRQLMRHPSVLALRESAEMKAAVRGLAADPSFVEAMTAEKPFDGSTVVALLQSDGVLNLLDQPGFLQTAREVLNELPHAGNTEASSVRTLYTSSKEAPTDGDQ